MKKIFLLFIIILMGTTNKIQSQNDSIYFRKAGQLILQQSIKPADLDSITFTRPMGTPFSPTNLMGTIFNNQIQLYWVDNSRNETSFKIERKTNTGIWTEIASVASNIVNYNDATVSGGTSYTYRVSSYNNSGYSINYSNLFSGTVPLTVTDIDKNTYNTVAICNQVWTTSNLKVTKYSDGTLIPQVKTAADWLGLQTGAWCYYNNDPANGTTYGILYNWYAIAGIYDAASLANPALRKKLAPTGYHIPTDTEWTTLTNCLGGEGLAGDTMKEIGTTRWTATGTNPTATNTSGFTGLPGGYRLPSGAFANINTFGYWWSSTVVASRTTFAWYCALVYNQGYAIRNNYDKWSGLSVRCVKD